MAGPEELIAPYVGLWEYQGENLWLRIHEDATWEFVNDQDNVIEYGTLWVDENGVTLHFDGSGDTLQLDRTVSGDLIDSVERRHAPSCGGHPVQRTLLYKKRP